MRESTMELARLLPKRLQYVNQRQTSYHHPAQLPIKPAHRKPLRFNFQVPCLAIWPLACFPCDGFGTLTHAVMVTFRA
ncbi:UNVERIFIED_CONTAM: hypothetical protein FKN15_057650 [Acipenser sinensis]